MAALNIINVASMIGKVAGVSLSSVSLNDVVINPVASNKLFKVNTLVASNKSATLEGSVTVNVRKASGSRFGLITDATLPVGTSLVVISKDLMTYLEEGDAIEAICSNNVDAVCSYEEIS